MYLFLFTPYHKLTYIGGCIAVIAKDLEHAQEIVTQYWKSGRPVQPHDIPVLYASHKDIPGRTLTVKRDLYEGGTSNWKMPEFAWGCEDVFPVERAPGILFVNLMER